MENKLTFEGLINFDFRNIIKYIITKPSGMMMNTGSIVMIDKNNISYKFICNDSTSFNELYKYVPVLKQFVEIKYAYNIKNKHNERVIYTFDRNNNKPYSVNGWDVNIIPKITITKTI